MHPSRQQLSVRQRSHSIPKLLDNFSAFETEALAGGSEGQEAEERSQEHGDGGDASFP